MHRNGTVSASSKREINEADRYSLLLRNVAELAMKGQLRALWDRTVGSIASKFGSFQRVILCVQQVCVLIRVLVS